jgi:hypothetical protein
MGTGGARHGAGRRGSRRKCEQMLALDVRKLRQRGYLQSGSQFRWRWSYCDEPLASVWVSVTEGAATLSYSSTPYDGDAVCHTYDVTLERTACYFGGARVWFRCPRCHRRCAVIYGVARDGRFGCRKCLRLAYSSEAEDPVQRCWRAQRKIEGRLTEDGDRPKGMRQKTFRRLCERWDALEEKKDVRWVASVTRRFELDPADL